MKRLFHAILWTVFSFLLVSSVPAEAQQIIVGATPIQTGFAVVTPLPGSGDGLSVSELFSQESGGVIYRSSVLPSPPVTLTSLIVTSDPNSAVDTGIAIVNPNLGPVNVRLTLNNNFGGTVGARVLTIGGVRQIARFVTELFPDVPVLSGPFAGQLFISTDGPVGVLGLAFVGPAFTSLPVASQLNASNVPITVITGNINVLTTPGVPQPIVALPASQLTPLLTPPLSIFPTFSPAVPVQIVPVSPGFNSFVPSPPIVFPSTPPAGSVTQFPQPNVGILPFGSLTGNAAALGNATGITSPLAGSLTSPFLGINSLPTTPITGSSVTLGTATGLAAPLVGNVSPVAAVGIISMPTIGVGVGGPLAQLLAQVATGGGWSSVISIVNTTADDQFVRIDFFDSQGGPMQLPFGPTIPALFVPAGGVAVVSTN